MFEAALSRMLGGIRRSHLGINPRKRTRPGLESLEPRQLLAASVVGRHVFYNNSVFDGKDPAANLSDDAAVAPDKTALLPGQLASFANYTNFSRGINGVIVDFIDLGAASQLGADDFEFRAGNNNDRSSWELAPPPTQILVRPGQGAGGSDRVAIVWPDNAIENEWLQVTVGATPDTGLAAVDVFYFGNAIGESGNLASKSIVDIQDERGPRDNPHAFFNLAQIDDVYDYNRDRYVNATDQIIARNHSTTLATSLRLLGQPQNSVTLFYDPETGELVLDASVAITTIEIKSDSGLFTGSKPASLGGLFDVYNPQKIFKLDPAGFKTLDVDLPPGLTEEFLLNDLNFDGSVVGGGALTGIEIVILPQVEPTHVTYEAASGLLSVSSPFQIESLEIVSSRGIFTGDPAQNLGGPNDVDSDNRLLKRDPAGFSSISFGNVMATGLSGAFVGRDLSFVGRLTDGKVLRNIQLSVIPQVNQISVTYDAGTGEIVVDSNTPLESLRITSQQGIFRPGAGQNLSGPNDRLESSLLSKQDPSGFRRLSFGNAVQTGWSVSFVAADLSLTGTLFGGDPIGNIQLLVIPESVSTTVTYDATTGDLAIDTRLNLTTVEIVSSSGIFTGDPALNLGGQFDVDIDGKIFKLEPNGFGDVAFGKVARTGLPRIFLERDLVIKGSRAGGGPLGQIELVVVPVVNQTSVVYDAITGELLVDSNPAIATVDIASTRGIFTGVPAQNLGGAQDVDTDTRIVKRDDAGFSNVSFGRVAESGLTADLVAGDVSITATRLDGGTQNVELFVFPQQPAVRVIYDGRTGEVRLTTNSPLESIEIVSASGIFTGAPATNLGGPSDIDTDTRILKQDSRGFREVALGDVATLGLDQAFVASDLSISGTLLGGTPLDHIDLEIIPDAGQTRLTYDARTGSIRIDTNLTLTTLEIVSARGIFTGLPAAGFLNGPNDVDTDNRLFKQLDAGFGTLNLDKVAETGLTSTFLVGDLTLRGTRQGGGGLGKLEIITNPLPSVVTIAYGVINGSIFVTSNAPLESFEIRSASGILNGAPARGLGGPSDVDTDTRIFKFDVGGFRDLSLGDVSRTGLTRAFVSGDLTFDGRLLGGEPVGRFELFVPDILFVYDAGTGNMSIDTDKRITTLEIVSASGIFIGSRPSNLLGLFDVYTRNKIFKLDPAGFGSLDLGQAAPDLTHSFLTSDLRFQGSVVGGGPIFHQDVSIVVTRQAPGTLIYDAASGAVSVDADVPLTSLEIVSASGIFTGSPALNLSGPQDVDTDTRLAKQDAAGFEDFNLGSVAATGFTQSFLARDLSFRGSQADGNLFDRFLLRVNPQENVVSVTYNAGTGEFSLDSNAPLESLEFTSKLGIFHVGGGQNLNGPNDRLVNNILRKHDPSGFRRLSFGNVAQTGWSQSFAAADLSLTGTLLGGDPVGNIQLVVIPEAAPSTITYDANTGELSVDTRLTLTTLEIVSASGIFTGTPALNLGGQFDIDNDKKIFKLVPDGFEDVTFGSVARTGLPGIFLERDLSIHGSRSGGGPLGQFELVVIPIANQTSVVYDAITGELLVESNPTIATLEIASTRGIFTGDPAQDLGGPQDVDIDTRIVKRNDAGFGTVRFGRVAETGLTAAYVAADVSIVATRVDGGVQIVGLFVVPQMPDAHLIYEGSTGEFRLITNAPLESINIVSASGIFTGEPARNLGGPSDVDTDTRIFKQDSRGFRDVSLGKVATVALDPAFVASDLSITGTLLGGTPLDRVDLEIIPDTGQTRLTYDARTGAIRIDTNLTLTTLEIVSARGIFTGQPATGFNGPNDVDSDTRLFKRLDTGFGGLRLNPIAETGLTATFLVGDLTLRGTRLGGGGLGKLEIIVAPTLASVVTIAYGVNDGSISVTSNSPLESFEIRSASGILTGDPARSLGGPNDVDSDTRIFKLDVGGFRDLNLGDVARAGLTRAFVSSDLTFDGRLLGGNPVGRFELIVPDILFVYDAGTGNVSIDTDKRLTTLEIFSASGIFTGPRPPGFLGGLFDVYNPNKIFKLDPAGFGSLDFGPVAAPGLTHSFLTSDLRFDGSLVGGGSISQLVSIAVTRQAPGTLIYDAASGGISVDADVPLTSLEIVSSSGIFTGSPALNLGGPQDVDTDTRVAKQDAAGFEDFSLGNVAATGFTQAFLARDLSIRGTQADGNLFDRFLLRVIPQKNVVSVTYNAGTGEFSFDSNAPLESLEFTSKQGIFHVGGGQNLSGPNDRLLNTLLHKQDPNGFRKLSFGNVAQTGWSESLVAADLSLTGTLLGGDPVGNIQLLVIPEPAQSTFTYDANTGAFSIDTQLTLTTLEIVSASGIFTGDPALNLGGQFDVDSDTKIFKLEPSGFGDLNFGKVARTGLTRIVLERDLVINGSRVGGGPFGSFELAVIPVENHVSVAYDAATGELLIESNPAISSFEISSTRGIFTGEPAQNLGGPQDVDTDTRIVKRDDDGFTNVNFGRVVETGLTAAFVAADVSITATRIDGSAQNIDLFILPREPSVQLTYDGPTGELRLTTNSPLESINIVSASGVFTGEAARNLGGPTDVDTDSRIFKQDSQGFRDLSLGNVAPIGLDQALVASDLTVTGTLLGGTPLDRIDLAIIPDTGETTLTYDARTGTIDVSTNLRLASLQLTSARGIFTGNPASNLGGPSDIDTDTMIVKIDANGFGNVSLGTVTDMGLTEAFVASDITIRGSRLGGGGLGRLAIVVRPLVAQVRAIYDAVAGEVSLESNSPLETFEIVSSSGIFTGAPALNLGGPSDIDTDSRIFKQDLRGFRNINFGDIAQPGWTPEFISSDWVARGTLLGGQNVGTIQINVQQDFRQTIVIFDRNTGEITVDTDIVLSSLTITSASGIFTANPAQNLGGPLDIDTDTRIVKQNPAGFSDVQFGNVGQSGLSRAFIAADLSVSGTRLSGVPLSNIQILVHPSGTDLIYNPVTGVVSFETERALTTIEVISASRLFIGAKPLLLGGLFDVFNEGKVFKLDPGGFNNISFGAILPAGLTQAFLAQDLSIDGSFAGGGTIKPVGIVVVLPPAALAQCHLTLWNNCPQLVSKLRETVETTVLHTSKHSESKWHSALAGDTSLDDVDGSRRRLRAVRDLVTTAQDVSNEDSEQGHRRRESRRDRRRPIDPVDEIILESESWSLTDDAIDRVARFRDLRAADCFVA